MLAIRGNVIILVMKVAELGEFGLIDLLAKIVNDSRDKSVSWQQLLVGIGDDAAAWKTSSTVQLATVDSFIQDVHFSPAIFPWKEVGWKALAVNLSDIGAMGGAPRYALVSLSLPGETEVESITSVYRGMIKLAGEYGIAIIGGNVSRAPVIVIDITVIGEGSETVLTRSTASPGEQIAVTGHLGAATAGLQMLTQKLKFSPKDSQILKNAFWHPQPRVSEGQLLVKSGIKTAIDISDGLIADLKHICEMSKVGARIETERVPIEPVVKANFGSKALELALSGGEDYELLFTGSADTIKKVEKSAPRPITVIGEVTAEHAGEVVLIDNKGSSSPTRGGWDHFTPG